MSEVPSPSAAQRTILVVDDQSAVCTSVAYYLNICGYRTLQAESGQAAIELFGKEQIDGILLDVQMPKLNGFETSLRLHALARETNRQIKIWFMTGIYYRELKEDSTKAGGLAVFQKPFDWPQLLTELEQGLSSTPPVSSQGAVSSPEQT